jgi:RNA polymerase sigma factor (sigma-70 family)
MEELKSLVGSAQTGDLDAYGEIVRRFQDMGYGYAYSVLGDFHLAEDATQEAFIEAYRCLENLRQPAAFPGWFRRIVFKHCDRLKRRKEIPAAPLEAAAGIASPGREPSQAAEDREMKDNVLAAIRSLPAQQREVTTLFYINGYSQNDIAEFLEVPTGTVKSRLAASRTQLKERMIDMVEETLKDNAPDERFSQKVIDELLGRPRLLEIEGHPVREIWDLVGSVLPDYKIIHGDEIVNHPDELAISGTLSCAYQVDKNRVLRTTTTITVLDAAKGQKLPVRLLTAGRVFRAGPKDWIEDVTHLNVFHQLECLCIDVDIEIKALKSTLEKVIAAVFAPANVEMRWHTAKFPSFENSLELDIKINNKWVEVAGCGMIEKKLFNEMGFDAAQVSGFAFGLGLERLAMLKYGIDDIRKLWQPPYVPE